MQFRTISVTERGKVHLLWTEPAPHDSAVTVTHELETDKSPAHPDFRKALNGLRDLALEACEFVMAPQLREAVTVTTLNFSADRAGRPTLIITAVKRLEKTDGVVVLNTPLLRYLLDGEDAADLAETWFLLNARSQELIHDVENQAVAYFNGRREQGDLWDQPAEQTSPELVP